MALDGTGACPNLSNGSGGGITARLLASDGDAHLAASGRAVTYVNNGTAHEWRGLKDRANNREEAICVGAIHVQESIAEVGGNLVPVVVAYAGLLDCMFQAGFDLAQRLKIL